MRDTLRFAALPQFFGLLVLAPTLLAQDNSWTISPLDSFANFTVKHLMVSTVHGSMGGLKGTVIYDPKDPSKDAVDATIDVNTLNTGVAKRDDQVKADYFDVQKFPVIHYKSTRVFVAGAGRLRMTGDLTIKGTTRPTVLEIEGPSQMVKDAQGRSKIGLTATARISRKEFGIVGTALDGAVETGGIIVSDEVAIELDIELMPNTPVVASPAKTK
jgi:polyisoprenoid-binding protein YceI